MLLRSHVSWVLCPQCSPGIMFKHANVQKVLRTHGLMLPGLTSLRSESYVLRVLRPQGLTLLRSLVLEVLEVPCYPMSHGPIFLVHPSGHMSQGSNPWVKCFEGPNVIKVLDYQAPLFTWSYIPTRYCLFLRSHILKDPCFQVLHSYSHTSSRTSKVLCSQGLDFFSQVSDKCLPGKISVPQYPCEA